MKKVISLIIEVSVLYLFAVMGNLIARVTHLPISGSIIGLFIVLVLLRFHLLKLSLIESGATFLMSEMLLFFIPSAVAIIQYKEQILQHGSQFLIVIVLSTITVMVITGIVAQYYIRKWAVKKGEV